MSDIVNEAVRESLADHAEDIAAFWVREREPLVSYDDMIQRLKKDGRI